MKTLSAALIALLMAVQPLAALAQESRAPQKPVAGQDVPPPYGPSLYDTPSQEAGAMKAAAKRAEEKQAAARRKAEPNLKLGPRRPTRQAIITMPPSAYDTSGYRPMPVPIPGPGVTPIVPSRPMPVECFGNTCIRADGALQPPPIGTTSVDATGRTCTQNGNFVQCY